MPVRTGASVLDALLFKKIEQAKENDIALTFDVSCPLGDTAISNYDLCSVFGNIIDNALEAVMPLEQNKKLAVVIEKKLIAAWHGEPKGGKGDDTRNRI